LAAIESGRVVLVLRLALVAVLFGVLVALVVGSRFHARISERSLVWRPAIGAALTIDVHEIEEVTFSMAPLNKAAVMRIKGGAQLRITQRHLGYVTFLLALHHWRGDLFPSNFSMAFKSAIYAANGVKET